MTSISIVTVSMNRTDQLLMSARSCADLSFHSENIIVDFGSSVPINRKDLPDDNRIKLYRAESPNGKWWLTQAFNLGFSLAQSDHILKLDADVLLTNEFADGLLAQLNDSNAHLLCNRLTIQDWGLLDRLFTTNGLFLCRRSSLEALHGFNPYIRGWGWDEIDLYSRFFLAGYPTARLPLNALELIEHGDDQRETPISPQPWRIQTPWITATAAEPRNRMHAQNEQNRQIAIASIVKGLTWPSLADYREAYLNTGSLPTLPKVNLFDQNEYEQLLSAVARRLLNPAHPTEAMYRVLRKLGLGPYAPTNARQLLDACGVDLSLVT